MHCKNCGWKNPDNATECEKCHSRFKNNLKAAGPNPFRPGSSKDQGKTPTVMGALGAPKTGSAKFASSQFKHLDVASSGPATQMPTMANAGDTQPANCPECGYPLGDGASTCPNCGAPVPVTPAADSAIQSPVDTTPVNKGTILSSAPPAFLNMEGAASLVPVSADNIPSGDRIDINGDYDMIDGRRLGTDDPSPLLSISCDNGQWNIEGADENTPVFIKVAGGKFNLVDGDIISVDGKFFRFSL